jgi:hypothetical protein
MAEHNWESEYKAVKETLQKKDGASHSWESEYKEASPEKKTEKEQPDVIQGAKRAVGLFGRDIVEAPLNLADYIVRSAMEIPRAGYNVYQKAKEFTGAKPDYAELSLLHPRGGFAGTNIANILGFPAPESEPEKLASAVSQGALGVLAPFGAAKTIGGKTADLLNRYMIGATPKATGLGMAGGAIGSGAGEVARQAGYDPLGQIIASITGSVVPSVVAPRINPKIGYSTLAETSEKLGVRPPTAAMIDPTSVAGRLEGKLMRQVGGEGPIGGARADISQKLGEILTPFTSTSQSPAISGGEAIVSGIRNLFLPSFKSGSEKVWNYFDSLVPRNTEVAIGNTQNILEKLTNKVNDIPELSKVLSTPKVSEMAGAIQSATKAEPLKQVSILGVDGKPLTTINIGGPVEGATLPFSALKQLRSAIGERLSNPSLVSDIPYSDLKQLYAGLSRDMENAAKAAGPEAEKAWKRANAYTKAGHERIENFLDPLMKKELFPENVFNMAISGGKEGGTKLNQIMKSIGPENRLIVASNLLRKISLSGVGNTEIDAIKFSKYYNQIDPSTRNILFGASTMGSDNARTLANIAKVGSSLAAAGGTTPPLTGFNTVLAGVLSSVGAGVGTALGSMIEKPYVGAMIGAAATPAMTNVMSRRIVSPSGVKKAFTESAYPIPISTAEQQLKQVETSDSSLPIPQ